MDVILGLDISTSVIGLSLLQPLSTINTQPLLMSYIDLKNVKGFWKKVDNVRDELKAFNVHVLASNMKIVSVFIEEPLKKFTRGKSSANTLSLLARFNAVVSYLVREIINIEPLYVDASVARKKLGIPILSRKKSGGLSQKEQCFQFLAKNVFLKKNWILNRNGKIQYFHYDEVDAFVMGLAGCLGLGEPA